MAQTPAKSRSKRAPAKAKEPRAAPRTAQKSASKKSATDAPKARAVKASKPAAKPVPKARATKAAPAVRKPAKPKAAAVRKAMSTSEAEAPSLAQYVREDHKLRESMVDHAIPHPWWDSALRSAVMLASAGARMVRRYMPGLTTDETKERDTLVPA